MYTARHFCYYWKPRLFFFFLKKNLNDKVLQPWAHLVYIIQSKKLQFHKLRLKLRKTFLLVIQEKTFYFISAKLQMKTCGAFWLLFVLEKVQTFGPRQWPTVWMAHRLASNGINQPINHQQICQKRNDLYTSMYWRGWMKTSSHTVNVVPLYAAVGCEGAVPGGHRGHAGPCPHAGLQGVPALPAAPVEVPAGAPKRFHFNSRGWICFKGVGKFCH